MDGLGSSRTAAFPPVTAFVEAAGAGSGRRAVVVGAGLGADAELPASRGYETVALDMAPTAVQLARARHPGTTVEYRVADLLDLPQELVQAFDLVVDAFTVQALPRSLRADAVAAVRSLVAPDGDLLAVQFELPDGASREDGPPWLLTRDEMEAFGGDGVQEVSLVAQPHPLRADGPATWVGHFRRTSA